MEKTKDANSLWTIFKPLQNIVLPAKVANHVVSTINFGVFAVVARTIHLPIEIMLMHTQTQDAIECKAKHQVLRMALNIMMILENA
jgi:hypothetical protein